ncbi:hypothetical protein CryarDRAFT_0728 [Cryptosporangium arvum DSM 44712]|uniref:Uncharacterized protein n=1 Tax=Cryptosporangium arvum DSM 44712 TaxID=927661 RepID=A0A010ZLZ6_9ACTN|nr:hypothetical protein CryarDRAFT_0728 [Cryptosporangium arvum DSM 44712]
MNATSRPRTGRPRFTVSVDIDLDGSWWVVRKPADLHPRDFANVRGKVRPLHAKSSRTCHPSVSHFAVTHAAWSLARPSLVIEPSLGRV